MNRLYVLAYNNADGDPDQTDYNVLIDGRNVYDQPINDQIRKYDGLRKIMLGKGEGYTTGSLLDYQYFTNHYQLTAIDLPKQKELDADPTCYTAYRILWNFKYSFTSVHSFRKIKRNYMRILQKNSKCCKNI